MSAHLDEELTAMLDGELPELERARVEAHLAGCPACAARRDELRAALGRVSGAVALEPSADLRRKVLAAVDAEPRGLLASLRSLWSVRFLVPAGAALGAGVVLLLATAHTGPVRLVDGADPEELAVAERLDLFQDYDVVASADVAPADIDVVVHLGELGVE